MKTNKTDAIIRQFTNQPESRRVIVELTTLAVVTLVVYDVPEDTILGIVCALVKTELSTKDVDDSRKRIAAMNEVFNKLFNLEDKDDE